MTTCPTCYALLDSETSGLHMDWHIAMSEMFEDLLGRLRGDFA